jgi:hypothetical protein
VHQPLEITLLGRGSAVFQQPSRQEYSRCSKAVESRFHFQDCHGQFLQEPPQTTGSAGGTNIVRNHAQAVEDTERDQVPDRNNGIGEVIEGQQQPSPRSQYPMQLALSGDQLRLRLEMVKC